MSRTITPANFCWIWIILLHNTPTRFPSNPCSNVGVKKASYKVKIVVSRVLTEEKLKISCPIRSQGGHLCFPVSPKKNLVEDFLHPVAFCQILFDCFWGEDKYVYFRAAIFVFQSEDIKFLHSMKFRQILFSCFWEDKNVLSIQRPGGGGGYLCFLICLKNTTLVENIKFLLLVNFQWRGEVMSQTIRGQDSHLCFLIDPRKHKLDRWRWVLASCKSFVKFCSMVSEKTKCQMSQPIRGPGRYLCFPMGPKNTTFVENIEFLLPVNFVQQLQRSIRLWCIKKQDLYVKCECPRQQQNPHWLFLASRDKCPGSICHYPSVVVHVGCVDKNFNHGHNFSTISKRELILHVYSLWWDLSLDTIIFLPCDLKFDLLLKKFDLGHSLHIRRDVRPCDQTFYTVTICFTLWPWSLTYFWKTFTLVISLIPEEIELSYFACAFLVTRTCTWCHNFWPYDLDLEVWPFENFNLGHNMAAIKWWLPSGKHGSLSSDNSLV